MHDLSFFTLLHTLDESEIAAFHRHLKQQHARDTLALGLLEYIRKLPKPWEKKKLDMMRVYGKITSDKLSDTEKVTKKMLNKLSEIHVWLKQFLLAERMRRNSLETDALWLCILQERQLDEEFYKQVVRFYAQINEPAKNGGKSYVRDLIAACMYQQYVSAKRPPFYIEALDESTDIAKTCTEIIRIKMACATANVKRVRPSKDKGQDGASGQAIKNRGDRSRALLELYENIYQMIETEQEVYFQRAETLMMEQANYLDSDELHGILRHLQNYVAIKSRQKEPVYSKKMHELNKFGLTHHLFTIKGEMTSTQFTNIVNTACFLDEFAWANSFIKTHSEYLKDDIRTHSELLAKATVYFGQKKFKEVLEAFSKEEDDVEFKDIHLIIRARQLVLRSYFELGDDLEKAFDYCISFEAQLKRKTSTGAVEGTLEFVRICKLILQNKKTKQELIELVAGKTNLYLREWLLEQIERYNK